MSLWMHLGLYLTPYIYVATGSAVGGALRFGCNDLAIRWLGNSWLPLATLLVNILGSFIIGLMMGKSILPLSADMRLLITAGLCGGFTTFSGFSQQTVDLLQQGHIGWALINIVISVSLCLLATWAGHHLISPGVA